MPFESLCKGIPKEFITYLKYVRELGFAETPNYKYLKRLCRRLFVISGYDFDYRYDWVEDKYKKKSKKHSKFEDKKKELKAMAKQLTKNMNKISKKLEKKRKQKEYEKTKNQLQIPNIGGGGDRSDDSKEVNKQGS